MPKMRTITTAEQAAKVPADEEVTIDISPEGSEEDIYDKAASRPEADAARGDEDRSEGALSQQVKDLESAETARRQAAEAAERARQEQQAAARIHQEELARERRNREQAEYDAIVNGIAAAQSDAESAQQSLQVAWSSGDHAAAAEAQRRLSRAEARLVQLENGKDAWDAGEQQRQQQPQQVQQPVQQVQRQQTPEEIINGMQALIPEERAWLLKHKELVTNPQRVNELQGTYSAAQRMGLTRGSEEYFDFFNERLGLTEDEPMADRANNKRTVAAPVSRAGTDLNTGRSKENTTRITLNPQQRDAAKWSGVDEVTYARNLLKLQQLKKEGYYSES